MLANLEARLNKTVSLDIVPEAVLARLYPEFYRLLPFMITAAINLVYWKCSENRLNLLNWELPTVRDVHTKWACYAYVFVLAANVVDYPEHVLEPGEFIVVLHQITADSATLRSVSAAAYKLNHSLDCFRHM